MKSQNAQAHTLAAPSEWVVRWTHLIEGVGKLSSSFPHEASVDGAFASTTTNDLTVLDVACGSGRHMKWLHEQGLKVLGVDRDTQALEHCQAYGEVLQADLEQHSQSTADGQAFGEPGHKAGPWPFKDRQFSAIIVTNYLWRPLFDDLLNSLRENGVLIYETFAQGHQTIGRPSRAEFLLNSGELLQICTNLHIIAYEEVLLANPERFVQRIVAIRAPKEVSLFQRYRPTSR